MKEALIERRKHLWEAMEDKSILLCASGIPVHCNEDDYYEFESNSNYFWMTGLERQKQTLLLCKLNGEYKEYLFIEEPDDLSERWTGKMPTKEEVRASSGVQNVLYDLPGFLDRLIARNEVNSAYFDTFRCASEDLEDYNLAQARRFSALYPAIRVLSLRNLIAPLRQTKDAAEIERMRRAVDLTRQGLEEVLRRLKPGMTEYQAQAIFEGTCRYLGAEKLAFPTIAGSGLNACSMHYSSNRGELKEGSLLLMDLGARCGRYCSDITRTYPVSGRYSERQRQFYELVLKANRAVAEAAKPGLTLRQLNDLARKVLGEGLVELGLIEKPEQVDRYYMHGVSHSIGVDVHDLVVGEPALKPGWVISDEPGLYIDEEEIGIRIEDDLLITGDGCEVLSAGILREPDEIEAFMAAGSCKLNKSGLQ